jgi:hypothetical protein
VGDYTRRLAGELIRQGHSASIVSFNDRFIKTVVKENQESDGTNIPVLRLPFGLSNKEKYNNAGNYINDFNPEWLSLQYVPYSFQKKGLPFGFAKRLAKMGKGKKWHIMFHELWVFPSISYKMRLLTFLQKKIIYNLISLINPKCVTTSIPLYQQKLQNVNKVFILPLFGNINIASTKNIAYQDHNDVLIAVYFGSFSKNLDEFKKQIKWLKQYSEYHKKKVELKIAGNSGHTKDYSITIAKNIIGDKAVVEYGYLPDKTISEILSTADIGVSRACYSNFGKSGSTIAMLEHGLPVLLRGTTLSFKINENNENICFCTDNFLMKEKRKRESRLNTITKKFVDILTHLSFTQ